MEQIFADKVALVTGAARGIGAASARMLASHGARVVLADLLDEVSEVAQSIVDAGGSAVSMVGDIADPAHSEALVALAADRFGGLDYAFNNAGIGGRPCVIEELSPDDWRKVIDVNLNGVFYGVRHQLPAMLVRGGGVIINTSSVLGIKPIPGSSLEYTAAKHGVIGLTRQVAVNYGSKGIRCNAICPGFIETPLTLEGSDTNTGHAGTEWFVKRTPLGRAGQPDDIASVVKMLCSDDARYINGDAVMVDGGFVLT